MTWQLCAPNVLHRGKADYKLVDRQCHW